jgi:hypothetical protein
MSSATLAPPNVERRVAKRFEPAYGTVYRLNDTNDALVWNISATGVSMFVANPPESGTTVSGALVLEAGDTVLLAAVRIVHVRKVETGDYVVGAQFVRPLSRDELQPFLTPPPKDEWDVPKKG